MSDTATPVLLEEDNIAMGLSAEAVGLVVRIANAVSSKIATDMHSVSDLLRRSQPYPGPMIHISEERQAERESENQDRLDKLYEAHMPQRLNELGTRQVIRASIGQTNGMLDFLIWTDSKRY